MAVKTKDMHRLMCLALCSGLVLPAGALAQEQPDEDEREEEVDTIEVTGYRSTLKKNLDIKKNSDAIVDAISAEDVGLDDINVGDALQRIPGVQVERDERTGESTRVSIRGTAPHLNRILLNNQQIASASSSNRIGELRDRSFNYSILPTELIETLEVYKSAEANVDEGSIGGTVVVRTRHPLDADANSGGLTARFFNFENANVNKPHVSGLYSWKNDNETFGFNLSYTYKESATSLDSKRNLRGYFRPRDLNGDGELERLPVAPAANRYTSDYDLSTPFVTVQYQPNDSLDFVFKALRSVTNHQSQGILTEGFASLAFLLTPAAQREGVVIEDGTVVSAANLSCCSAIPGIGLQAAQYGTGAYQGQVETTAFDLAGTWEGDSVTLALQAGHSYAEGYAEDMSADFGARSSLDFDLSTGVLEMTLGDVAPQDYALSNTFVNDIYNGSDDTYFQADLEYGLDNSFISSIEVGFKWRDHNKSANRRKRDFDEQTRFDPDGSGVIGTTLAEFAGTPITNFKIGDPPTGLWRFSISRLREWQDARPEVEGTANRSWDSPQERYRLNEAIYAAYLKANFETYDFRGNLGIRAVQTSTTSRLPVYQGPIWAPTYVETMSFSNEYTDILPSLNVNYVGLDDVILRFAAARVIGRPNYGNLSPQESRTCENAANDLGYECGGSGGNPDLQPFRLNQYDVAAEWYMDDYSYLAVGLFRKDIESYITTESTNVIREWVVSGFSSGTPVSEQREFELITPVNSGLGGVIQGFEISYQQDLFHGFGVRANYTYANADLEETPEQIEAGEEEILLDHSENTYNASVFYQGYRGSSDLFRRLAVRLSYTFRSEYRYNIGAVARGLTGFRDGFGQFDLNANYALTNNVELTFQGINLTDNEINWYASRDDAVNIDRGRPLGRFNHGRRYGFGLKTKF